jgi:hypothetical protein
MRGKHKRGKWTPTEHRVRVRRYARLFNRGFGAIAICVVIGLYALLVLGHDLLGSVPLDRHLPDDRRRALSYRVHEALVESVLRLARAAGMSQTVIRIALGAIVVAAFGVALMIGRVLWCRQPARESTAEGAGVERSG